MNERILLLRTGTDIYLMLSNLFELDTSDVLNYFLIEQVLEKPT